MTLPIIAYHFQRISLVSIIANPFILPIQPPVMVLGGLAVLLGMLWQPAGAGGWNSGLAVRSHSKEKSGY
jgi:competence protein ComEC